MHTTLLDNYIGTCRANEKIMPVYRYMLEVIEETTPLAHRWDTDQNVLAGPHVPVDVKWPHPAMCLYHPRGGMTRGLHTLCSDGDEYDEEIKVWFADNTWSLEGLLLFQAAEDAFDIIPLAVEAEHRELVLADMQLHFYRTAAGWGWRKANTGPVNSMFHNYFIDRLSEQGKDKVEENIEYMGNVVSLFLGTYWNYILGAGDWEIRPARAPKVKEKNGKVIKTYKPGTAGYCRYVQNRI